MVDYCEHDVRLLERLYVRILPWIKSHPNYANYLDATRPTCPNCGSYTLKKIGGCYYTKVSKTERYCCTTCGTQVRDRINLNTKKNKPGKIMLMQT